MNPETLREWALELGFVEAAFCSCDDFEDEQRLVKIQQPLAERRQLKYLPKKDHPEARSIVVLLWAYPPASEPTDDEVFIDSYYFASNAAYHAARKLENRLQAAGVSVKANVPYPARRAATRAGLGVIGKNSMLITERFGSRVVIILMTTDIEPPQAQKHSLAADPYQCLSCGKCISACPSGALTENGLEYPHKCLRNFMMEGVVVPQDIRKKIGMRLIGCDMCQRVCPMQPAIAPPDTEAFRLDDFLSENHEIFSSAVARLALQIGRNAARPQRIRAQAALLAGNAGDKRYASALKALQNSEFDAVRIHAKWALEQISADKN